MLYRVSYGSAMQSRSLLIASLQDVRCAYERGEMTRSALVCHKVELISLTGLRTCSQVIELEMTTLPLKADPFAHVQGLLRATLDSNGNKVPARIRLSSLWGKSSNYHQHILTFNRLSITVALRQCLCCTALRCQCVAP